jgi:uncharacterized membrane protein
MKNSRMVWGVVCLVIAAILATLYFTIPAGNLMFQIGNQNFPWLPAAVIGIVGVVLLATGATASQPSTELKPEITVEDKDKAALNKRLENIAWGLFLIMLGGFALVPGEIVPKGLWSIGVGLIMLGLNLARYLKKIKMSGFTTVLGIISLIGGLLELLGVTNIEGALLLIILGAYLVVKPWFEEKRLFGKAEES